MSQSIENNKKKITNTNKENINIIQASKRISNVSTTVAELTAAQCQSGKTENNKNQNNEMGLHKHILCFKWKTTKIF